MAATTDRLSDGRLMLGVDTGEALNERPLGFPFPAAASARPAVQGLAGMTGKERGVRNRYRHVSLH